MTLLRGAAVAAAALAVCLMMAGSSDAGRTSRSLLQTATVGATGSYDVAPFDSIIVCVPFTVLVAPSSAANKYSVTTAYNAAVAAAVVYRVEAQTLYMDINKDYDSAEAIKVTISLPANQLTAVTSTGVGDVVVNPGFNTTATTLSSRGTGNVAVRGMTATAMTIRNDGTGNIFAGGALSTVDLKVGGTGMVVLSGANKVTGQVDGTSNVYVDTPSGSRISVDATGVNTIYYTQGTCTLGGQGGIAQCKQATATDIPTYTANWTCGTHVEGAEQCTANAASAGGVQAAGHRRLFGGTTNNYGTVITEIACSTPAGELLIPAQ